MRLGILVEAEEGLDWDTWRRTYAAAERLGFESVWISDHLQSPWSPTRHGLEPWVALAVAAADTHRVVLGPLVSPVTFREPALVARMAESLDRLTGGRFVLGLGLGWNADEHAAAGIAFPAAAERSRRLIETIQRVRCEPGARRVPILVGGAGARSTLPVVARHADAWNVTTASADDFARASRQLDALCRDVGRDPSQIARSAAMGILVGRDRADLARRAERMRGHVPPLMAADDVLAAARQMGWLVGTPNEIVAGLRRLAEVGVERAILGQYDLDDAATLELLAESVLPAVG
jgi:alkanesulfonate monooxygenase SsuD/methylene tetrahydromethanopterin reductase-like flavin-dependent oxidoreductase (luciferase family)